MCLKPIKKVVVIVQDNILQKYWGVNCLDVLEVQEMVYEPKRVKYGVKVRIREECNFKGYLTTIYLNNNECKETTLRLSPLI